MTRSVSPKVDVTHRHPSPSGVRAACLVFLLGLLPGSSLAEQVDSSDSQAQPAEFKATQDSGLVFLNGLSVPSPYVVTASSEGILLNGKALDEVSIGLTHDFIAMEAEDESESQDYPRRRKSRRGFSPRDSEFRQTESIDPTWNPRGAAFVASRFNTRRESEDESARRRNSAVAEFISISLQDDYILVLFDNERIASVYDGYDFCKALTAERATTEETQRFLAHATSESARATWRQWLSEFTPDPDLRRELESRVNVFDTAEANNNSHIAAQARLESFAYPLTIVGMLLSVYAFGHMLQWIGRGFYHHDAFVDENIRYTAIALLLILGMSAVDLIWTILAGQAGVMSEVNPLAARFIHSPIQLALFKVFATGVGLGVLFVWRQRRQIQQATWWMCLVCVLLTFRWVVFDSMMN